MAFSGWLHRSACHSSVGFRLVVPHDELVEVYLRVNLVPP